MEWITNIYGIGAYFLNEALHSSNHWKLLQLLSNVAY